MKILIINGPNLNFLGIREKSVYGDKTYDDLLIYLRKKAEELEMEIEIYQSNGEGFIINKIQDAYFKKFDAIVINAGAYTHYSYAIRDAIASVHIRTIEVHLSDIDNREPFRKVSVIRDVCEKSFYGKHFLSYGEALEYLNQYNNNVLL